MRLPSTREDECSADDVQRAAGNCVLASSCDCVAQRSQDQQQGDGRDVHFTGEGGENLARRCGRAGRTLEMHTAIRGDR